MIKISGVGTDRSRIVITGHGVTADNAVYEKLARGMAGEYSPADGDPELWLADRVIKLLGGKIDNPRKPAPEIVDPRGASIEKAGSGIMLAWFPPADVRDALAKISDEDPEDIHLTLAYFGKELSDAQVEALKTATEEFCDDTAPMDGELSGVGKFHATENSDGLVPVYASVSVPHLERMRTELVDHIEEETGVIAKANFGYTPHITLAYQKDDTGELPKVPALKCKIDTITLAVAGKRYPYKLKGEVEKADTDTDDFLAPFLPVEKREHSGEYLTALLEKTKAYLPGWLYKQIHVVARGSAGGKTRWKRYWERKNKLAMMPTPGSVHVPRPMDGEMDDEEHKPKKAAGSFALTGAVSKVDDDRHLVFGWASVSTDDGKPVTDRQGDVIKDADLEDMAYDFVLTSRKGGEMHKKGEETVRVVSKLVESCAFTKEKQKAMGVDMGKVGWWIGFKVDDDAVWKKVKDGTYAGFSIGGSGTRRKIDSVKEVA